MLLGPTNQVWSRFWSATVHSPSSGEAKVCRPAISPCSKAQKFQYMTHVPPKREKPQGLFTHKVLRLQAEKQLGWEWTLMRATQPNVPNLEDWLAETLPPKSKVGIDPFVHSAENARSMGETLRAKDVFLSPLYESNLVDQVWEEEQPAPPTAPLRVHPLKYAGKDVGEKVRCRCVLGEECEGSDCLGCFSNGKQWLSSV